MRKSAVRGAFTLLEVILALAILAGALATLGELIRNAVRNADGARDLMRAELLAETIMSQVQSGELALGAASSTPCDDDPNYVYSIDVDSTPESLTALTKVTVTVNRDVAAEAKPETFTLTKWIIDPSQLQPSTAATTASQPSSQPTNP